MQVLAISSILVATLLFLTAAGCSTEYPDCTSADACMGDSGNGRSDADARDAEGGMPMEPPVPAGCDVNADAKDSLPCAATSFALFVNADAPAGGDGSKEKPFRAIQGAIDAVAKTGKHRIYICGSATYAEHLEMKAATYARLLGGFECAGWTPAEPKPRVAPSDAGYALHIDAVPSEVRIEDVAFEAIAGTAASRSSIGVFVASSPNVLFKRATVKANAGAAGTDGNAGKPGVPMPSDLNGSPGTSAKGGDAKTCTCDTGGTSVGAKGGNTSDAAVDGQRGMPVIDPPSPTSSTGEGQPSAACNTVGRPRRMAPPGKTARAPPPVRSVFSAQPAGSPRTEDLVRADRLARAEAAGAHGR